MTSSAFAYMTVRGAFVIQKKHRAIHSDGRCCTIAFRCDIRINLYRRRTKAEGAVKYMVFRANARLIMNIDWASFLQNYL